MSRWTILVALLAVVLTSGCDGGDDRGGQISWQGDGGSGAPDVGTEDGGGDLGGEEDVGGRLDAGTDAGVREDAGREQDGGGVGDGCEISGRLVSADGPVAGVRLVLCNGPACHRGESDRDGRFTYRGMDRQPWALKILGAAVGYTSTTLALDCTDQDVDLGTIELFQVPERSAMPADGDWTTTPAVGLEITANGPVNYPNFEDLAQVVAIPVEAEHLWRGWHLPGRLLAAYVFSPYATLGQFGFRAVLRDPGTPVALLVLDHSEGTISVEARGVVADNRVFASGDALIHQLTWWFFVEDDQRDDARGSHP